MAENKASALKQAKKYQLKVYYIGDSPAESGKTEVHADIIDSAHKPWLFKCYTRDGVCHQYADTYGLYHKFSEELGQVLDAVIVNAKQRDAIGKIVDRMLYDTLGLDMAHENDLIIDPFEC